MTTDRTPPIWEARFRVPLHTFPHWSPSAPDRLVITSSESGSYQAHTWDPETGERRKLSDEAVGATYALPTADGEWVTWFRDISGDELGAWMVVPRTGGTAEPLFDDLPKGWPEGLVLRRGRSVVGLSGADGFAIWIVRRGAGAAAARAQHRAVPAGRRLDARRGRRGEHSRPTIASWSSSTPSTAT